MALSAEELLEQMGRMPVSEAVAKGLRIAQTVGATNMATWCRLELAGYWASNPAMSESVTVPEYRGVVGQHADLFGRVLLLKANLAFVNETRLRNGAEELEQLARTHDTVILHDPHMCEWIREHLEVEVYSFRFSAAHLTGILSAMREELRQRLADLPPGRNGPGHGPGTPPSSGSDEVLQLKPNIHGIGVDLKALWRRWRGP